MPKMGMKAKEPPPPPYVSLADALFSGTQQRVLGLLFGQPERSFYATELIGLTGGGSGAVQRELARLEQSGLVTIKALGNQKYYQANPASPIFTELTGIAQKTVGLAEPLRQALLPLTRKISAAFVYGSVAKKQDTASSDIDLMVISDKLVYADVRLVQNFAVWIFFIINFYYIAVYFNCFSGKADDSFYIINCLCDWNFL